MRNVVEANHRALLRHSDARSVEGTDGTEGRHIVEGHERGKAGFSLKQFFSERVAGIEARKRIARLRQIHHQLWVDFKLVRGRERTHSLPARSGVCNMFWPANDRNVAVAERVEMLDGGMRATLVVYGNRTH